MDNAACTVAQIATVEIVYIIAFDVGALKKPTGQLNRALYVL